MQQMEEIRNQKSQRFIRLPVCCIKKRARYKAVHSEGHSAICEIPVPWALPSRYPSAVACPSLNWPKRWWRSCPNSEPKMCGLCVGRVSCEVYCDVQFARGSAVPCHAVSSCIHKALCIVPRVVSRRALVLPWADLYRTVSAREKLLSDGHGVLGGATGCRTGARGSGASCGRYPAETALQLSHGIA